MYKKYSTNYIRICGIKKINSANEAKQQGTLSCLSVSSNKYEEKDVF